MEIDFHTARTKPKQCSGFSSKKTLCSLPSKGRGLDRLNFCTGSSLRLRCIRNLLQPCQKILRELIEHDIRNFRDDARSHLRDNAYDVDLGNALDLGPALGKSAQLARHFHGRTPSSPNVLTFAENFDLVIRRIQAHNVHFALVVSDARTHLYADS